MMKIRKIVVSTTFSFIDIIKKLNCFSLTLSFTSTKFKNVFSFFNVTTPDPQFMDLPCSLFGESIGGITCFLFPNLKGIRGAFLVALMCSISEKVKPQILPQLLVRFLPQLAIVSTSSLLYKSVKVDKNIIVYMNSIRHRGKIKLGIVVELLRVTDFLGPRLCYVKFSLIGLHGRLEVVTDPNVSRLLYEEAKSEDKTIKIYDGVMRM